MQILTPADVPQGRVLAQFGHGAFAPFALFLAFLTPIVAALALVVHVRTQLAEVPWIAWVLALPLVGIVAAATVLAAHTSLAVWRASFLASNWVLACTADGIYLKLRSYRNHHFPDDGPTVVHLAYAEIASVREVVERYERGRRDLTAVTMRWIELELPGVDTGAIAARVDDERTRPAPESSFLGVRSRTRHRHVPVFVPHAGCVRIERVRAGLLHELARHVRLAPKVTIDVDRVSGGSVDARVRERSVRGDALGAIELVRVETGASLAEARERVQQVAGEHTRA